MGKPAPLVLSVNALLNLTRFLAELVYVVRGKVWPTIDCFADCYNCRVHKFYSRFWNPGSAGIDAFFLSWEGANALLVPPVPRVYRVLAFISQL
jgi:hypothetical protein